MRHLGRQVTAFAVASILWGAAGFAADASVRPDGSTPLEWAVFHGDIAQTKKLLAAGADAKAVNAYGVNPMQLAADASNTELIRLLLKAGARGTGYPAFGSTGTTSLPSSPPRGWPWRAPQPATDRRSSRR